MATIRNGNQSALLVVDAQVGVMAESWQASGVADNVARAVVRARESGAPVFWVQHESADLPRDSAAWQFIPELEPAAGEVRIHKRFNSSFEGTELEQRLGERGVTHLVLAGAQTNWCIRATAYAALDRGYDLTLLQDAHTTGGIDLGNGKRVEAADIVTDLNLTMRWLSYPGRSNRCAATDEVSFAANDTSR